MQMFETAMVTTVENSLDIQLKIQNMKNAQLEQELEALSKHFAKYGHLNAVDIRSGETMNDPYGLPMKLRLPDGPKSSLELLAKLHTKMIELQAEHDKKKEDGKFDASRPVDLTPFRHLLEPTKKENE